MDTLREISRWIHVIFGFVGLVAFWFPVFARKGGKLHTRAGVVFEWSAYVVTSTALLSSLLIIGRGLTAEGGPAGRPENYSFAIFLGYLAIATFSSVRQAVRVVQTKRDPAAIATPFHRGLGYASIVGSVFVVTYALVFWSQFSIILLALSPVGIGVGRGIVRYASRPPEIKRAWFYEHMGAILGAGVAFHTAFAVFGAHRIFDFSLGGPWAVIPWILPAAIGIPGGYLWERYYRRKFKDPMPGAAVAT